MVASGVRPLRPAHRERLGAGRWGDYMQAVSNARLGRTATFWLTICGCLCFIIGHRRLASLAFGLAGFGGIGMAYGRFAAQAGIACEPIPVWRARHHAQARQFALSVLAHLPMAVAALALHTKPASL